MKKTLLTTLLCCGLLQAQELTIEQQAQLRNYHHSLSGKRHYQRTMKRMAKISKEEAQNRAKSLTSEEIIHTKLMHHDHWLFYSIRTSNQKIKINALTGQEIKQGGEG